MFLNVEEEKEQSFSTRCTEPKAFKKNKKKRILKTNSHATNCSEGGRR